MWFDLLLSLPAPFIFTAVGWCRLDFGCTSCLVAVWAVWLLTSWWFFFPLAHLTQSYWTPVWLVLLMHFLPQLLFPFSQTTVQLFSADTLLTFSPIFPTTLFSFCGFSFLPFFLPIPLCLAAVGVSCWLVVSGWFWLFFLWTAWWLSVLVASSSSCYIPTLLFISLFFRSCFFLFFVCVNCMLAVSSLLSSILSL